MIPFILNCRKQKPFYSDRKQISGCQGMGARERQPGGMTRGGGRMREALGSNGYIHDLDYGDGFAGGCISQNVSNCII